MPSPSSGTCSATMRSSPALSSRRSFEKSDAAAVEPDKAARQLEERVELALNDGVRRGAGRIDDRTRHDSTARVFRVDPPWQVDEKVEREIQADDDDGGNAGHRKCTRRATPDDGFNLRLIKRWIRCDRRCHAVAR